METPNLDLVLAMTDIDGHHEQATLASTELAALKADIVDLTKACRKQRERGERAEAKNAKLREDGNRLAEAAEQIRAVCMADSFVKIIFGSATEAIDKALEAHAMLVEAT